MERSVLKYCTDLLVLMDRIVLRQKDGSSIAEMLAIEEETEEKNDPKFEKLLTVAEGLKAIGLKIDQIATSFRNLPSNFSNMPESGGDINREYCKSLANDIRQRDRSFDVHVAGNHFFVWLL